nr:hypothetical protein [Candidatus Njordarchaeum guaymaensis]
MIRALWLFDPFGTRILRWVNSTYGKRGRFDGLEDGFLSGPLSKAIRDFIAQANAGKQDFKTLRFESHQLIFYFRKGFLVIAEVDSPESFEPAIPLLSKTLENAIVEDPLSFSVLLCNYDMPGKNRLIKQLSAFLKSQEVEVKAN